MSTSRSCTEEATKKEELRDFILAERDKGNIIVRGLDGVVMSMNLDEFVKQPADGMLYDLNRLEEISLTFLADPKWVNDFAVAMTIRKLVAQRDSAEARLAQQGFNPGCIHNE